MAQFDFLASRADSELIVRSILERPGTNLVPQLWYKTPEPVYIRAINAEIAEFLKKHRHHYIFGEDFSQFPPFLRPVRDNDPNTSYTVQPTHGGPCLELTLPASYEEEGRLNLASGSFVYHSEYLNPGTQRWRTASPALKAAYKDMLGRIKQNLVRHTFHKPIWIGKDGLAQLQAGKARIAGFGLNSPKTYEELMKMRPSAADCK
jgi:hypothetical protein